MPAIEVAPTTDNALVLELLTEWKPASARAFVGSRMKHLLATVDGEPIGVLVGTHDFCNWDLLDRYQHLTEAERGSYAQAAYVRQSHRSRGAGTALLDAFVAQARAARTHVVIAIPDENDEGRDERVRWLARNGFKWLDYPGGVREPWIMGLALTS